MIVMKDQACNRHETCYARIILSILSYYGVVIGVAVVERSRTL